jgi:predicted glycogen debranching enzyme
LYTAEQARGLDAVEDLMAPGWLTFDLGEGEAWWVLEAGISSVDPRVPSESVARLRSAERSRRTDFHSPLHRAADAFVVRRGAGRSIIAGYPWFTDWGRDTFLALRGLCLSSGRFNDARDILLEWSGRSSEGMLPNRFPDHGEALEFNAVDASLWFVIAVRDLCAASDRGEGVLTGPSRTALLEAVTRILTGYHAGTRFGIKADAEGLLACGEPGSALTWMDARVDGQPVTPRIGKPVEVHALWLCALAFASRWHSRWQVTFEQGRHAMDARFWNASRECLYDVVDVNHESGRVDGSLRPNQIFAIGGLGEILVDRERAKRALEVVERALLTPLGLRTLAPGDPGYVGCYGGRAGARDAAYHQGTVWPYLLGPFVEAWLAIYGDTAVRRQEASERFLRPLAAHVSEAGLGHLTELADAEAPHRPGGCPFQAWSMGALLRISERLG